MVYDNFIVGPRCSATVFNILSRLQLPLDYTSTSEKELGFYFSTMRTRVKEQRGGGAPSDRFIKVVWHIRSPRLLPRSRVDNAPKRDAGYIILFIISL